jgi:hypothetical protein
LRKIRDHGQLPRLYLRHRTRQGKLSLLPKFPNQTPNPQTPKPLSKAPLTINPQVNCSFYYKIGACRHGDRCSRKHVKPSYSQTILLPNLYQNPQYDPKNKMNPQQIQMHFDAFYEDIWSELCKYGLVEEVVVCDNNNDREYKFCSALEDSSSGT